jgi:hypothetical protein
MSFRHSVIALALAGALLGGCDKKEEAAAPAPAKAVVAANASAADALQAQVQAFTNNDLKSMLMAALPPKEIDRMRTEWDAKRKEPVTEEEKKEFAESWAKLTAPDGVDKIMAEVEPQMAEMKPQLPGMIAMMQGMGTMSIQQSTELTPEQKTQATQFMNGLGGWLNKTDFTDAAVMRKALTALADGLRATGITSLDDVNALSFDQLLEKSGPAFGGLKNALAAYGFSLDQIAQSVKSEVVSETGDAAKLKVSYTLFDSPLSFESEMTKVDGRWYGKDMLAQMEKAKAEAVAEEAAASQEPVVAEGEGEDEAADSDTTAEPES